MTKRELVLYLHSGHPVDIEVQLVAAAPGFVKKVTFYPDSLDIDYIFTVEYESISIYASKDIEGPHVKYLGEYANLDLAIADAEIYLGKSLDDWKNYTREPLEVTLDPDIDWTASEEYLEQLRSQGDLILPNGAILRLTGPRP